MMCKNCHERPADPESNDYGYCLDCYNFDGFAETEVDKMQQAIMYEDIANGVDISADKWKDTITDRALQQLSDNRAEAERLKAIENRLDKSEKDEGFK